MENNKQKIKKTMKEKTMLAHLGENRSVNFGAVVPPIYQNSLFTFESWEAIEQAFSHPLESCIYTRGNNPSALVVEEKIAALCGGEKAKLFASGMGAISSAILHCVDAGGHIIRVSNTYGPTTSFINYLVNKFKLEVSDVIGEDISDFEQALRPNTQLIYLESPSSMLMSLQDIEAVAQLAKSKNIRTIIDNSWATPINQKPLTMGIDIEVHTCSKYLSGHSDIVAGVIIGKTNDIDSISLVESAFLGAKIAPFEAWLLMRSLRTLHLRVAQHQKSAMEIATYLENHPKVNHVNYPGLASFKQKALADKQMTGYTGLISFVLASDNLTEIKNFVNAFNYFSIGVSWGGHESLIYAPAISYLKDMSLEEFKKMGLDLGMIRISVGLEDCKDLITDLDQAFKQIT